MDELIRVLNEFYPRFADGGDDGGTGGTGTQDPNTQDQQNQESQESEATVEFEGVKIPKKVWDKLEANKQKELDRIATKASQTAKANAKKELEAEIQQQKLAADGKWKELLELEKQKAERLEREVKTRELKMFTREKLLEKKLDPNVWGELISGDSEEDIALRIEHIAENIEKVKAKHLEELKGKGPDGVPKPSKAQPGETSMGKKLAEQAKQSEEIAKKQSEYFRD